MPTTSAATVNVTGNNFSDIQYAIDTSNIGDTLDLGNGTYYGYGIPIIVNKITLSLKDHHLAIK